MQNIPFISGQEHKILELFEQSYKKQLDLSFWKWRFNSNPFVETPMINLMWSNNLLVGHYAVSAMEMIVNGEKLPSSLSGTTMTHPQYEGRGIFSALASTLYERVAVNNKVSGVLGFPNKNSHYGLVKKLGWKDICILPTLSVAASKVQKRDVGISRISEFEPRHDLFIRSSIEKLGFTVFVNRSPEYLNWRFLNNPINDYSCFEYIVAGEIKGVILSKVFKSFEHPGENEVDILEMICAPEPEIVEVLLAGVKTHYDEMKIPYLKMNMWMSLYDPRHLLLERMGFQTSQPLTYMCFKSLVNNLTATNDPRNWYVAMGDSDVY